MCCNMNFRVFFKPLWKLVGKHLFFDDVLLIRKECNILKKHYQLSLLFVLQMPLSVGEEGRQPLVSERQTSEISAAKRWCSVIASEVPGTWLVTGSVCKAVTCWSIVRELHPKDLNLNPRPLGFQKWYLSPISLWWRRISWKEVGHLSYTHL